MQSFVNLLIIWVTILTRVISFHSSYFSKHFAKSVTRNSDTSHKMCIDTKLKPLDHPQGDEREDSDNSWRTTANPDIVPVKTEKFSVRPEVITFDAFNTLIEPSQSVGRWYREALNIVCDMRIRLPRPLFFSNAFKIAVKEMSQEHPCFGARSGLTSREWWFEVVKNTYKSVENLNLIEQSEWEQILPAAFELLYVNVFSSKTGWVVKEDVLYTLTKLQEWRDQGAGPKLGVISNFDERILPILRDLDLHHYFDFVITSREAKFEKPEREIFDLALQRAKLTSPLAAYHVGDSVDSDVAGAIAAGWTSLRYLENFDDSFPDWTAVDTPETSDAASTKRQELMWWGRKDVSRNLQWVEIWGLPDVLHLFGFPDDPDKPIATTVIRGLEE